jgi:2-polyprenyl-6-hydroxyphenyl methylase/3-demethylubiquinone-9 3-methyltransferase
MRKTVVNNQLYHSLGERWYQAKDDPVALLRAEAKLKNPWVLAQLEKRWPRTVKVLDIGCGAGFLSNTLAKAGHQVTAIDLSKESLKIAANYDTTHKVDYHCGNAYQLPYADGSFDLVCAMDFLEHVEEPAQVVAEVSRVLKPGGLFCFHTFNRTPFSWLVILKGVEWFVKNTPPNLHIYRLFVKPEELIAMSQRSGLEVKELIGMRPVLNRAFWQLLLQGWVREEFRFSFTPWLWGSYLGMAEKS